MLFETCDVCGTILCSTRFKASLDGTEIMCCSLACWREAFDANNAVDPSTTYRADDASTVNIDDRFTLGPGTTGRFLRPDDKEE